MTKRNLALVSISFTTAAMLISEQRAYSSETLWDLLRSGDPSKSRAAPVPNTGAQAPGTGPVVPPITAAGQTPVIDPKTGQPVPLAGPNSPVVKKKRSGLVGVFDSVGGTFRRLGRQLNSDLKVTGNHSIGLHMETISGNGEAYQNDIYYGRKGLGGAYQNTDLTIQGKVLGLVNFETHYSNNLYGNPYDNRVSLNYATKSFKLDAGDITGSIQGNSLIEFSRSLQGVQLSADVMRGIRLTSLYSQTKAQTRTIVIPGGNGPGPYYVYVGQIVDGSDRVRVNNREMRKGPAPDGDYTLDPYTGELRFSAGTIIGELDSIAVTFETYGYNQSPGTLTGWRADMTMLKGAKFGVTYLAQTASGGSSRREKTDQFQGYGGDPTTAYMLDYPVDATVTKDSAGKLVATPKFPMSVTVAGVAKVYGTDYLLDPLLTNRVYFAQPIPIGQLIRITYTPVTGGESSGNRSVMGADANCILGKMGTITAEVASSRLDQSGSGLNGGAWQIRSDLRFLKDRMHLNWNLRNIGSNFTAIESPGFRRNERGLTVGMDYAFSDKLKLVANMEKTKRPSYDYTSIYNGSSGSSALNGTDDFNQVTLGLNWQLGKTGQLSLNHNAANTRMGTGGKSLYATDNLTFTYGFKSFNFDFTLGRNTNQSSYLYNSSGGGTSTDPTLNVYSTDSLMSRLNMRWRANDRMSFAAVLANSQINTVSSGKTNAQDIQLTAEVLPLRNMRMAISYQLQNSGGGSIYGNYGAGTGTNSTTLAASRQYGGLPNLGQYTGGTTGNGYNGGSGYGYNYGGLPYYGGGGINSGMGGYGNYSGGVYGGGTGGYSFSSFGGKSRGFAVTMNYQPIQNLTLDLNWNSSSSEGDYLYNSRRNDIGLNISYSLGERLTLTSSFNTQRVNYIGGNGGTNSSMAFFTLHGKPLGKLGVTLNYQLMRTASNFQLTGNQTGTTGGGVYTGGNPFYNGGGYYNSGGTNLNGFGFRLEYPIWRGNNLFFQFDNSVSTGAWGSTQRQMMMGVDFNLSNNMTFTLGWRNQEHNSSSGGTSGGNYSYRVGSLDADLNLHF